jgi:hypothetical protein
MQWNFTKTAALLAVGYGVVSALIGWIGAGRPENGIGTAIWIFVLVCPLMAIADLVSWRRRVSAGRRASGHPSQ